MKEAEFFSCALALFLFLSCCQLALFSAYTAHVTLCGNAKELTLGISLLLLHLRTSTSTEATFLLSDCRFPYNGIDICYTFTDRQTV